MGEPDAPDPLVADIRKAIYTSNGRKYDFALELWKTLVNSGNRYNMFRYWSIFQALFKLGLGDRVCDKFGLTLREGYSEMLAKMFVEHPDRLLKACKWLYCEVLQIDLGLPQVTPDLLPPTRHFAQWIRGGSFKRTLILTYYDESMFTVPEPWYKF